MPTKLWLSTSLTVLISLCLIGCANSTQTFEEKVAQQEAIHAHKALVSSYEENKASIERLAKMEGDLTQLLKLLSTQAEVPDVHSYLQPTQPVVKHAVKSDSTKESFAETHDVPLVSVTDQTEKRLQIPDFVVGIHLKRDAALSQAQQVQARINIIRQSYPLVFNGVNAHIIEPHQDRKLFFVTAYGFSSRQEASVFCKAISRVTRHCSELKNYI
ncbi:MULTISPECIES: hypothetical protein [Pseudoalteromonas]|uniref:SPOR domain-containing protein n=1 Tax=Pseudoalteromonas luteoviolacea (strain 2ta16) TaxID=1353533 RepID=V4I5I3_PSEL2|nr:MULTISPECIES: hypothetical protein [Pseudoalteromonas]ESP95514.1 hypothetical protein PL2TA16_02258 [Pseudoalteromonas luteoviolacea 2ta16]KZN31094.1 hypothetical protein N483_04545 [Pseudoalteromonas luteoviolacea NCIMB 1944]MCG7548489.1 hypothetical protein [Pseudoalteromonas sp. Of7M-16]